jgi:tetratricopeptide (TPR) repeat protein
MKAEKRHELEQNELADWLGEQIEAVKPYAPTLGIVLVGGALAILLGIYLMGAGGAANARAWSAYFAAFNERDPELPLEAFTKEMPNTPASLWALQSVGDINLARGSMQLFSDREEAKKSLEKAEVALKRVEAEATDKMLRTRAQLSLGKLYESLCKPEEAKKFYQKVTDAEKDSPVGKVAQQAVKRLSDSRETELLAWFAEQKPRRPSPGRGSGGLPGLPNDLPERPDLSLPGFGSGSADSGVGAGTGLNLEGFGSGKTDDTKLEFPKPAESKPGESKPGETVPQTTDVKPPQAAKPETTKPAATGKAAVPEKSPE